MSVLRNLNEHINYNVSDVCLVIKWAAINLITQYRTVMKYVSTINVFFKQFSLYICLSLIPHANCLNCCLLCQRLGLKLDKSTTCINLYF